MSRLQQQIESERAAGIAATKRLQESLVEKDREIARLKERLECEQKRSRVISRICYMGYSYGMGSQTGIDDLRSAINRNGHG